MKIILTSRVSGLGKIGEIVDVKNGYAKNFLIPTNKAICCTANSESLFNEKRAEYEKASEDASDLAQQTRKEFIGKKLIIVENASDDGRLYGSVTPALIASKINKELGKEIVGKTDVILAKTIKEIGVYDVKVDIHCDVDFSIRLVICRLESEVENLIKAHEKAIKQASQKEEDELKEAKAAADKAQEAKSQEQPESEEPAKEEAVA